MFSLFNKAESFILLPTKDKIMITSFNKIRMDGM